MINTIDLKFQYLKDRWQEDFKFTVDKQNLYLNGKKVSSLREFAGFRCDITLENYANYARIVENWLVKEIPLYFFELFGTDYDPTHKPSVKLMTWTVVKLLGQHKMLFEKDE